jgi:hypothetical protein
VKTENSPAIRDQAAEQAEPEQARRNFAAYVQMDDRAMQLDEAPQHTQGGSRVVDASSLSLTVVRKIYHFALDPAGLKELPDRD